MGPPALMSRRWWGRVGPTLPALLSHCWGSVGPIPPALLSHRWWGRVGPTLPALLSHCWGSVGPTPPLLGRAGQLCRSPCCSLMEEAQEKACTSLSPYLLWRMKPCLLQVLAG